MNPFFLLEMLKRILRFPAVFALIMLLLYWLDLRRSTEIDQTCAASKEQQKPGSLFDKWHCKGNWWVQGNDQARSVGEFSYTGLTDNHGLELATEQSLEHEEPFSDLIFSAPSDEAALWIYGETPIGTVSLSDAIDANTSRRQSFFLPKLALIGRSTLGSDAKFRSARIEFPGLHDFLATPTRAGEPLSKLLEIRATFEEQNISICFEPSEEDKLCFVKVAPETAQSIEFFISAAYSLQYFLSIFYGFPICPRRFSVETEDAAEFVVLYQFDRRKVNQNPSASDMAILYSRLKVREFDEALKKWLGLSEAFLDYSYNFFGNFFEQHSKARVNLVFHSQSLERFHGLVAPDVKPSEEQLKAVSDVTAFIKEKIPVALHQDFQEVLKYLKQPSQRLRLEAVLSDLQKYIQLFDDSAEIANFVNCVVKTRNQHIHGGGKKQKRHKGCFNLFEETIAVELLKLANLLSIIRHLGIREESVNSSGIEAYRNWQRNYRKYLSKKVLERKLGDQAEEEKYVVNVEELRPCFFCGTKRLRQTLNRDGAMIRARTICPNKNSHPQSQGRCLDCGAYLADQGSSGWAGETWLFYCSNNECPGKIV